jgi:hypothetical protein
MEEKPQPSMWERSTTRRFLRWLFSARTMRRGLITLAWIVSLIALYYGLTDWRGHRAWNEYRQNYEAHVAPLEFQAYIPKPIPYSENFASTPFVHSWFKEDTNSLFEHDTYAQADNFVGSPPKRPAGRKYAKHFQNLVAWQEAFAAVRSHAVKPKDGYWSDNLDLASRAHAAAAVLDGLKDDKAVLEELRLASARPLARYPIVYDMENPGATLFPHLRRIKETCIRLEIKACAELAAGQNENALEDAELMLYLTDTVKTEPSLISYLVRLAFVKVAIQPIWEGLAEHRWTDAQLQQLQGRLEPYNFLSDMQWSLQTERATEVLTLDLLRMKGLGLLIDNSSPWWNEQTLKLLGRFVPSGWYEMEKLNYCLRFDDQLRGSVDASSRRVFPRQINSNELAAKALTNGTWHAIICHQLVARTLLADIAWLPCPVAMAQTATDQAAIACALERYRLANGQFPENLQALVPRFITHLPNDVITGEPFKYRRNDDGRFVLYSVGWNEKDDGGVPGSVWFDKTEGDWVWEYPAP